MASSLPIPEEAPVIKTTLFFLNLFGFNFNT